MANHETKAINPFKITKYVFPREPLTAHSRISDEIMEDLKSVHRDGPLTQAELYSQPDVFLGGVLMAMRTYLLGSTHKETQTLSVRTPTTWWDHFKHDMLMSPNHPILRRIVSHLEPPAYKYESKEVVKETRLCPHNNSYFADDETHARWLSWQLDLDGNLERKNRINGIT
jgi:hypothetical protein